MAEYITMEGEVMDTIEKTRPAPSNTAVWVNSKGAVSWPSGWSDVDKAEWLNAQYGLTNLPPLPPAAMYVGSHGMTDAFRWEDYDATQHVLMAFDTFQMFLDGLAEAESLSKGMKTVNRKRRKQNQVQRRMERRLAQARGGREQQRSEVEATKRQVERLQDRLTTSRAGLEAWRRSYADLYDKDNALIKQLTAKVEELTAQLAIAATPPIEEVIEEDGTFVEEGPYDSDVEPNAFTIENINTPLDEIPEVTDPAWADREPSPE